MVSASRRRLFFFFFSSRRRHTRFDCDWSSDVCSSDLALGGARSGGRPGRVGRRRGGAAGRCQRRCRGAQCDRLESRGGRAPERGGVGRASWRGRGEISGGAGSFKKKKKRKNGAGEGEW